MYFFSTFETYGMRPNICQMINPLDYPKIYANLFQNLRFRRNNSFWGVTCVNTPRNMLLFLHETMYIGYIYMLTTFFASPTTLSYSNNCISVEKKILVFKCSETLLPLSYFFMQVHKYLYMAVHNCCQQFQVVLVVLGCHGNYQISQNAKKMRF